MKKFPYIPDDLLSRLEKAFPDKIPRGHEADLSFLQGQQSVMDFLRNQHQRQNPQDME